MIDPLKKIILSPEIIHNATWKMMWIIGFLKIAHSKSNSTPPSPIRKYKASISWEETWARGTQGWWQRLACISGACADAGGRKPCGKGRVGWRISSESISPWKAEAQGSQRRSPTTCGNVGASLKRLKMLPQLLPTSVHAQIERSLSPLVEETKGPRKVARCKHFPYLRQRLSSVSTANTGTTGLRTMISWRKKEIFFSCQMKQFYGLTFCQEGEANAAKCHEFRSVEWPSMRVWIGAVNAEPIRERSQRS